MTRGINVYGGGALMWHLLEKVFKKDHFAYAYIYRGGQKKFEMDHLSLNVQKFNRLYRIRRNKHRFWPNFP